MLATRPFGNNAHIFRKNLDMRGYEGSFFDIQTSLQSLKDSISHPVGRSLKPGEKSSFPKSRLPQHRLLDNFTESYVRATGLPLQWHSPGEFSVGEDPAVPDFCKVMSTSRKACQQCIQTHLSLQDPAGRESRTTQCFAGLTSSAVPVVSDDQVLGFLHTGHCYVDRARGCGSPGRGCVLPGRAERRCACAGACRETPKLTTDRYEGANGLVRVFAGQLGAALTSLPEGGTYPAIDHAVRQIRAAVTHDWRLGDLARQTGMHPGYFSEQFHQHTGITFTRFLATLRVERARYLLDYTALPVSEIAFASGFRSISQFNRVFRMHTGCAPGDMRKTQLRGDAKPET